ncbi:hypothetical protein E6H35_10475 [Candidatus Bathyarchaeota archaeon]|nr:MAG: hypothetical protein E6H35_10475 [Candidatus Bathyarchaeota archaeon]
MTTLVRLPLLIYAVSGAVVILYSATQFPAPIGGASLGSDGITYIQRDVVQQAIYRILSSILALFVVGLGMIYWANLGKTKNC